MPRVIGFLCPGIAIGDAAATSSHSLSQQILDLCVHTPEFLRGHPLELIP